MALLKRKYGTFEEEKYMLFDSDVYLHSFFADTGPAVLLNADPDPALQNCNVLVILN